MTTPKPTSVVDHGQLTLGHQLGQGGQGTVYQVAKRKINKSDGGGWDVAYKEYSAAVLPQLDAAALAAQVDLLSELSGTEGRWLCDKTAWPAAVVERQGAACGFLMRAVPDRYQFTFQSLNAATPGTQRLANLEYLLNDDSYVASVGLTISDRDRLAILADLAATLTRLHRIGITVGDLSPKNLLFTTDPQPECFLIDCDAMRLRGATVLPQAETPDWQIPAGEEKATRTSDVYKLALLAIRLFARDQAATDPAALAAISPALGDLARASLNPDAARRPTPAAWAEQLTADSAKTSTIPAAPGGVQSPSGGFNGPRNPPPGTANTPQNTPVAGATSPGTNSAGKIAAGVLAAAVALIVVLVAVNGHHSSSDDDSFPQADISATATWPDDSSTTDDPYDDSYDDPSPDSSPTDDYDSDPTTDPPDPDPTYDVPEPDPTSVAPAPPPPPPPAPRPNYYGAIAVARDGSVGKSWDYSSASAANQGAMSRCPRSDCKVLVGFVNSCGAVAYNPNTNQYWGGRGATETAAENDAISNAGGGHWIAWVCTTRY